MQYLSECDYIIVLKDGKVFDEGTYEKILNSGYDIISSLEDIEKKLQNENQISNVNELKENTKTHKIIKEEERNVGEVKGSVYFEYMKAKAKPGALFKERETRFLTLEQFKNIAK